MSDDASRPDNRACPDGNAAADGGICTDPDVFLQRNGCRGANAVAALLRVDGMTGAGKAYAGGNKGTCSDVYRRGIQNDAVIIDDRQAVGMDIEAIVTVEIWLNAGHGRAGAQQGLQDTAPLFLFVRSGAVVLPAQLLCTVLFLRGGVFIAADVGGRAFHNIQSVHRVCPFHTVFFQVLYHILCRCVIGCFSSFVCPLDLLHRFALSQLIHQLVQIADLLHQRFFDALQLYVADAALYEHPVRIELRSISKKISIQRSILHRSLNLRDAVTSQPTNNFIYFCLRPPLAGCLFHQHRIYFCKWHGIYFFSFHFCPSLRCVYVQCIPRFRTKKNVCRRIPDDNIIPVLKIRNLLIKRSMIRSQSRQKNKSNCIRV